MKPISYETATKGMQENSVTDLCLNQVLCSQSQRQEEEEKTEHRALHVYTAYSHHFGLQTDIMCLKIWLKGYANAVPYLHYSLLQWQHRHSYRFELMHTKSLKMAGKCCQAFGINARKSIDLFVSFSWARFQDVILKITTQEKIRPVQSYRMIDGDGECYRMVWRKMPLSSDLHSHSQYALQMCCRLWPLNIPTLYFH